MDKKKAFTLVEMLVVLGILAALVVTVIPMVANYLKSGKDDYNDKLKSQLLLSGKSYYSDNKDKLPVKIGLMYKNKKDYDVVSLPEMQSMNYVSKDFIDSEGNGCKESFVYVRKNNTTNEYDYHACLRCTDKSGKIINYSDDDLICHGNDWSDGVSPTCSATPIYNSNVREKNDHVFNPTSVKLKDVSDSKLSSGDGNGKIIGAFVEGVSKSFSVVFPSGYTFDKIQGVNFIDRINSMYKKVNDRNDEYNISLTDGVHTSSTCANFVIDKEKPVCDFSLIQEKDNKTLTLNSSDNYSKVNNISKVISDKSNETNIEDNGINVSSVSKNVLGTGDATYYGYTMDEAGNLNTCKKDVKIKMFDGEKPYCTITNDKDDKWYSYSGTYRSKTLKAECYVAGGSNSKIDYSKITVSGGLGSVKTSKTNNSNSDNKVTFDIVFTPSNNKAGTSSVSIGEGFVTDKAGVSNASVKSSSIKVDSIAPSISYSVLTSKESGGWYKAPFKLKLSCSDSNSGVSSFKVNNSNFTSGNTVTRSSAGNPVSYGTSCVDKAGNSSKKSNNYYVRVNSSHSSCGVQSYKTCRNSACGCQTYKYCTNGCKTYNYHVGYRYYWKDGGYQIGTGCCIGKKLVSSCNASTYGGYKKISAVCVDWTVRGNKKVCSKYRYGLNKCARALTTYKGSCKEYYYKKCGCKTYYSCTTKACGVKSYKTCWHY